MGFCFVPIDLMNVRTKFEVRIALPSRNPDIIGVPKIGLSLSTPTLPVLRNFQWAFFG